MQTQPINTLAFLKNTDRYSHEFVLLLLVFEF